MKIALNNIGIIKNSTIQLDGLTIITGQNNSGKTTVGKVVYSLIDAVANLQAKARNDRLTYIDKGLADITSALDIFRTIRRPVSEVIRSIFGELSASEYLFSRTYRNQYPREDAEAFAHKIYNELSSVNFDSLEKNKHFLEFYGRTISTRNAPASVTEVFKAQISKALTILDNLFEKVSSDSELIDYARESINQVLRIEFSNQIQPVSKNVKKSSIIVTQNDTMCFCVEVNDNRVKNTGQPVFFSTPYSQAYLIDTPFIMDSSPFRVSSRGHDYDTDTFLNAERILTHDNTLKFVLRREKRASVFEETLLSRELAKIQSEIDLVLPGQFDFSADGEYYIHDGYKLKVSNLAAGSKVFSIIKVLLEKGEINENTMLILDEPEAHLHPSWQNKFAEIMVLLVKELHVNILLTTHSSNFMLAIDAYMRKHGITEKTNFYQTKLLSDGFVEYQCVNDDMGRIYADFMQSLSEVKVLRNQYVHGQGE